MRLTLPSGWTVTVTAESDPVINPSKGGTTTTISDSALRRLGHLSPEDREAVEALTRSLMNKLLHAPTVRLRKAAGNGRGVSVLDTVRYLFELDRNPGADMAADQEDDAPDETGSSRPTHRLQPDEDPT